MAKIKKPTWTSVVLEFLRKLDDFANRPMIMLATRISSDQFTATVHCLRKYRVIDVIIQPDGSAWWYALPAELDTRVRHLDEIADGIRRHRRSKPTK